jgi:hypothetical protein
VGQSWQKVCTVCDLRRSISSAAAAAVATRATDCAVHCELFANSLQLHPPWSYRLASFTLIFLLEFREGEDVFACFTLYFPLLAQLNSSYASTEDSFLGCLPQTSPPTSYEVIPRTYRITILGVLIFDCP